jgi:adenine phosphoribosyltransferase
MDFTRYLRTFPNFPKKGILFYDISPLIGNGEVFQAAIDEMYKLTRHLSPTKIVAAEARGFLFGPPLALCFSIGVVPIRKPGKLPGVTISASCSLEYGQDILHMQADALSQNDRVLIVDDVLATGGTVTAMKDLVLRAGASIVGCVMLIELSALRGREKLGDIPTYTLLQV